MEGTYNGPFGSKHYLLSEEDYEELKNLQTLLMIMANVAYDEEQHIDENDTMTIPRVEMKLIFQQLSVLIGEALERLDKGGHIDRQSHTLQ
ncbi:XAC0095 family protein [Dyella flava]|uniref:Uncharacterized protein n=1 Tax=Dyella flava TaxID=1920170 RepID=A0ABS2K876_9GAMM|nr:hypothetical protein [Dyella flava]MBM7127349.1 hypothetical protein [Dyella flava]GLQ50946.1 hypothetical protein GCM10010872_23950 [Dyella flava]